MEVTDLAERMRTRHTQKAAATASSTFAAST